MSEKKVEKKISALSKRAWKDLCDEIRSQGLGKEIVLQKHPELDELLVIDAVEIASAESAEKILKEEVKNLFSLELYGKETSEIADYIFKEIVCEDVSVKRYEIEKAIKSLTGEFREVAFKEATDIARTYVHYYFMGGYPAYRVAAIIANGELEIFFSKKAFGMLIKAIQIRLDEIEEEERNRIVEEEHARIEAIKIFEAEKKRRAEEEKEKLNMLAKKREEKEKRLAEILARPRTEILLDNGFSGFAFPVKSQEEAFLLNNHAIVLLEEYFYRVEKSVGGKVKLSFVSGRVLSLDTKGKADEASASSTTPKLNEMWVVFGGNRIIKAVVAPAGRRDEFVGHPETCRFIVEEDGDKLRLYRIKKDGLRFAGFVRKPTPEEKSAVKLAEANKKAEASAQCV